jgi:hypothetical protein
MKTLKIFLSLMLVSTLVFASNASKEFKKTWSTSHPSSDYQTVEIDNQYGKIHVTTGDQKTIEISVTIQVDLSSESSAQKMLDKINITEESNNGTLTVKTNIDNMNKMNNADLNINYTVSFPRSMNTKLTNAFGDVFLSELEGNATLNISYGSIKTGRLLGSDNSLELSFGNADIQEFVKGSMNVSYSNLELESGSEIDIKSSFSNSEIDKVETLRMKCAYDNLELESVGALTIKGSFSNVEIGTVSKSVDAKVSYGGFEIDDVLASFTEINIEAEAGEVDINIEDGTSYSFHCKVSMGDMDVPSGAKLTQDIKEMMSREKSGTVGSKPGNRKVDIVLSQGDLELD